MKRKGSILLYIILLFFYIANRKIQNKQSKKKRIKRILKALNLRQRDLHRYLHQLMQNMIGYTIVYFQKIWLLIYLQFHLLSWHLEGLVCLHILTLMPLIILVQKVDNVIHLLQGQLFHYRYYQQQKLEHLHLDNNVSIKL